MFSAFFIRRPIFASVISIIIMLAGIAAIKALPIAQYPTIAPPSIQITANYPGASAKTVEDTVQTDPVVAKPVWLSMVEPGIDPPNLRLQT